MTRFVQPSIEENNSIVKLPEYPRKYTGTYGDVQETVLHRLCRNHLAYLSICTTFHSIRVVTLELSGPFVPGVIGEILLALFCLPATLEPIKTSTTATGESGHVLPPPLLIATD